MNNLDKIRNYIISMRDTATLRPGDRLPGYHELMEMFHISYATVASSISKLAAEGLIEIQRGNGTYLTGGQELTVLLNVHPTSLTLPVMEDMLNKYIRREDLRIKLVLRPVELLASAAVQTKTTEEFKAAISVHPLGLNEQGLPPALLCDFEGYDEVLKGLKTIPRVNYDHELPFTFLSYQRGVNSDLLQKTGYSTKDLTADFAWWSQFERRCRDLKIAPASIDYFSGNGSLLFQSLLSPLLSMIPYSLERYTGDKPLFNTPEGRRFLQILKDTALITRPDDPQSFFHNGAVMNLHLGSWIAIQNFSNRHPEKRVEALKIVPYLQNNGRKQYYLDPECLKAYFRNDATVEERNRVWKLMKQMVSREFQLEYCGMTGFLSVNRSIRSKEYAWNEDGKWQDFFPASGDLVMYGRSMFSASQQAILSILLENFRIYQSNPNETLERMDKRRSFFPLALNTNSGQR